MTAEEEPGEQPPTFLPDDVEIDAERLREFSSQIELGAKYQVYGNDLKELLESLQHEKRTERVTSVHENIERQNPCKPAQAAVRLMNKARKI